MPEGVHPLFECAHDGEWQAAELEHLAHGVLLRAVQLLGHFLGDHADFVVGLLVLSVEEPARDHDEISNDAVLGEDSQNLNVALFTVADGHTLIELDDGRCGNDARHVTHGSMHVINGERIRGGVGNALRTTLVFGFDQICADSLNLVQDVLLASHADGDYQNEGSGPNHHAERGQGKTYFIAAESIVGEAENLTIDETRPRPGRSCRSAGRHSGLDATR